MRAPPHKEEPPMLRYTTHGYSFGTVSLPPNILFGLLGIPQLHVEAAGEVLFVSEMIDVVVVVAVVVVVVVVVDGDSVVLFAGL